MATESDFIKQTFSLQRKTLAQLHAITKARHGRVDRFVSATVDQLIEEAFERLSPEQQRYAANELLGPKE